MLLAQITNGQITRVAERAEYAELANPPLQGHLDALGLVPVCSSFEQVDMDHKLVSCDAYLLDGIPYNVTVQPKTLAEINTDKANALASLRGQRNQKLSTCDYTQVADYPGDKAAWAVYRQALRDLPASVQDARIFTNWPVAP
jgi:hypothetical protein